MKIISGYKTDGCWWFRIFDGYGLWYGQYKKIKAYFSERNGIRKPIIKTKNWRIFILYPNRFVDQNRKDKITRTIFE